MKDSGSKLSISEVKVSLKFPAMREHFGIFGVGVKLQGITKNFYLYILGNKSRALQEIFDDANVEPPRTVLAR